MQKALRESGLESSELILCLDLTKSNEWSGTESVSNLFPCLPGMSLHMKLSDNVSDMLHIWLFMSPMPVFVHGIDTVARLGIISSYAWGVLLRPHDMPPHNILFAGFGGVSTYR